MKVAIFAKFPTVVYVDGKDQHGVEKPDEDEDDEDEDGEEEEEEEEEEEDSS